MVDQYVKDPKDAVARGMTPEVGERGGIRYRGGSATGKRTGGGNLPITNRTYAIFIGEVGNIGIFEIMGAYKAYVLKGNDKHLEIVKEMKEVLRSGGTIFDAMEHGRSMIE